MSVAVRLVLSTLGVGSTWHEDGELLQSVVGLVLWTLLLSAEILTQLSAVASTLRNLANPATALRVRRMGWIFGILVGFAFALQLMAIVRAHEQAAFADLFTAGGVVLLAAYCAVAYQLRDAFYSFDRSPPRAPRIEDVT